MSFKERVTIVTLVNFSLILLGYSYSIWRMMQRETFIEANVFRLYGWVIFFAVVVSIIAIIITNFAPTMIEAIRTGDKNPEFDDVEDERDKLIDLRGTRVTYAISSFGTLIAMLTYVFGQPALVMFASLIFFGILAQIVGDITRLMLYRGVL